MWVELMTLVYQEINQKFTKARKNEDSINGYLADQDVGVFTMDLK